MGFKNVIIANRMAAESTAVQWPFIDSDELPVFRKHKHPAYYWWVVLHELLGHGTGKMLVEQSPGQYNFDIANPPLSPMTGTPIESWYRPGQTWTGQFEDLAATVDECRAELVGAYLMDDKELLVLFGFTETTEIRASDGRQAPSLGTAMRLWKLTNMDKSRTICTSSLVSMGCVAWPNSTSTPW